MLNLNQSLKIATIINSALLIHFRNLNLNQSLKIATIINSALLIHFRNLNLTDFYLNFIMNSPSVFAVTVSVIQHWEVPSI